MPREILAHYGFNRGLVSPLALARIDLKRLALSAETMTNWMPRALGSMMLRPGLKYLGASRGNAAAKYIPFVFSTDDTALVEVIPGFIRIWIDDELVSMPTVTASVTNGTFDTDLSSWTDADESGGTSSWQTGGYAGLQGNGTNAAILRQEVTVNEPTVEHALEIHVNRGPVTFRVGGSAGGEEYISETTLGTGFHSIAFTPSGNFHIQLSNRLNRLSLVNYCSIQASGTLEVPLASSTIFQAEDLSNLRWDQSGDIIFLACDGFQQTKIERRGTHSWSHVLYEPEDGPFRIENTGPITLTSTALTGTVTITASSALFKTTLLSVGSHEGALFRITSTGQEVTASVTAENTFTNAIRVTGVDSTRIFTIVRSGTWSATVTLQRSLDDPDAGPWEDVTTYTTNATITYDDGLDNQIAYYRIGVKTGNYTSGTAVLNLKYAIGSIDGVVKLTSITSSTVATATVLSDLGGTAATDIWAEGEWSGYRGYPTSVAFVEGRLAWAGRDGIWISISDSFYSFDDTFEGDAGTISRTIGSGPVDNINWILALQRLILGAEGAEFVGKSSSQDEPITPTNFNIKPASTQGSAAVQALKIDKKGIFVQRGGTRVMEVAYDGNDGEYGSVDLTIIIPEIGLPSITRMAAQRQPDTRIHCIRSDGTVGVLVYDRTENILAWVEVETDGTIEDVVTLPGANGSGEDAVYYHVNRTINGSTVRYLEKWALESDCQGGALNKQADSFITYTGVGATGISGLDHLEGETVVIWGNSKDLGTKVVSSGAISGLSESVTNAVVGLSYTAQWKSSKLSSQIQNLTQKKSISHLGVILKNTYYQGLKYGRDFDNLDDLPLLKDEAEVTADTTHATYDQEAFEFDGVWDTDSRLCLQAGAPNPCTILAAIIPIETNEKT